MRFALVNPNWEFDGSIYVGCRDPHLPLEYGYARALLERVGHDAEIIDGQLDGLTRDEIRSRVADFDPDAIVITTAPSYLFWRRAPPELRVPQQILADLDDLRGLRVVIGPHASTTPAPTLRKLNADVAVLGESDEVLPQLAAPRDRWIEIPSIAYRVANEYYLHGGRNVSDMRALPALHWPTSSVRRHRHHHHRFEAEAVGPGAEMETSRGCPYHCSHVSFPDGYRYRPLNTILEELDGLIAAGIEYVYFIDEVFLPNKELLAALVHRPVKFGVQTRIDLWTTQMLDLLGAAGCVSIEASVESLSPGGCDQLDGKSRLTTEQISDRLLHASETVPFVQANLDAQTEDPDAVDAWRQGLIARGVWVNKPVPRFPYPGSPDYSRRWGRPDDQAWERAAEHYLASVAAFSDLGEARPASA